ncbi:hypothetical protein [Corallococcus exercitus]|uniref:hypothetical protein n=1 Tax=Corallococcus exercitus TaxID=2316736 RepID=UPI0035D3F291
MDPFKEPEQSARGPNHSRSGADPFREPGLASAHPSREEGFDLRAGADFFTEPQPRDTEAQASPFRAAREEILLQGPVVIFPDGARIVLGNEGGRPIHRGTVAVRGPCSPSREDLVKLGLTEAQARALEFVLTWFGSPFDSVTTEPQSGGEPHWGAWPLSGPTLITALAHWKQQEPEAFEARLGRLGLEATPAQPPEPASLRFLGSRNAARGEGRDALSLFTEDPRLLAALAQAGRERGAQLAQLETLVTHVLRPVLASCVQDAPADSAFSSARALALLFLAELRLGHRGVTRLVTLARDRPESAVAGEHAGERLAEDLRSTGRSREASELWRVLTSPELADPA